MSRSLFLLLTGIYGLLLAAAMLFMPTATLITYGVAKPDLDHMAAIQYIGMANGMLGFMSLALRNSPTPMPFGFTCWRRLSTSLGAFCWAFTRSMGYTYLPVIFSLLTHWFGWPSGWLFCTTIIRNPSSLNPHRRTAP